MGEKSGEIRIIYREVDNSISRLCEIREQLQYCMKQELLLEDSTGETAEQTREMYEQVRVIAAAMEQLVGNTITLVTEAEKKFKETDEKLAKKYFSLVINDSDGIINGIQQMINNFTGKN